MFCVFVWQEAILHVIHIIKYTTIFGHYFLANYVNYKIPCKAYKIIPAVQLYFVVLHDWSSCYNEKVYHVTNNANP